MLDERGQWVDGPADALAQKLFAISLSLDLVAAHLEDGPDRFVVERSVAELVAICSGLLEPGAQEPGSRIHDTA